jgi:hypothetical protein
MTKEEKIDRIKALQRQIIGDIEFLATLMDKEVLQHCEQVFEKDPLDTDACAVAFFKEDLREFSACIPTL